MIPRRRGVDSSHVAASESEITARIESKRKSADSSGPAIGSALAGVPPNDQCASASPILGEGVFEYDNSLATLDGPSHAACVDSFDSVGTMIHDIWYCWTATCTGAVELTSCGEPALDTKFAVYGSCDNTDGSPNCPPGDEDLFPFGCNDDDLSCFNQTQSSVTFLAESGQSYLFRIGTYPGNPDIGQDPVPGAMSSFRVTCLDPPCTEDTASDRCQDFDRFAGTTSDRVSFRVADDFSPTESGEIAELCWWGQYLFNYAAPDTFEIRYYADDAGLPGVLLGGPFAQADGTLIVSPPVDTAVGPEGFRIFEYTAIHGGTCSVSGSLCDAWAQDCPNVCDLAQTECQTDADCDLVADDVCTGLQECQPVGVPVVAGECYWIEITNDSGGNFWFWEDGLGGDVSSLQDGDEENGPDGYTVGDTIPNDLSFCVNVTQEACGATPCKGATGSCCEGTPNGTPGCDDPDCCAKVCACDPFCCGATGWDEFCQGDGYQGSGCGAAVMCADLCACPDGTVAWLDPLVDPIRHPNGLVDARQPWPVNDPATPQGFQTFFLEAPMEAGTAAVGGCWTMCETGNTGVENRIDSIVSHGDGTYTLTLERPITPGELTTLTYTSDTGVSVSERFAALPGDANGDRLVTTGDINSLIDCINLVTPTPCDEWQTDINHSGVTTSGDILRLIDLLNGAGSYGVWITQSVPTDCVTP